MSAKLNIKYFILFLLLFCSDLKAFERNIALILNPGYTGEISFAYRIKFACKNINWKATIVNLQESKDFKENHYDFAINLVPGINEYERPSCKNYLTIFHPLHHYFKENGFLKEEYKSYDGYLLTYIPDYYGNGGKDFTDREKFSYIQWYPTVHKKEFQIVNPSYLFHICCNWGNRFADLRFKQLFKLLDNKSYTRFYGYPLFQYLYPNSYAGQIPHDCDSLYAIAAQAGISLVIHSEDHNRYGLPSGRIFEAAASSTVIICDQNSFVQEHFGDSVLYINTDLDGRSIYNQIQQHMYWIRTNKMLALEKAKKAHQIYKEKFLLEDQLIQLGKFHDQLSNKI